MKPVSRPVSMALFALFASVMLATRFHHSGTALNLPDASMAVFFLGGLYLRRQVAFAALVALAIAIDWISIAQMGVNDFCVTPAYAFLPLAYAALWYGARAYAPHLRETPMSTGLVLVVALLCASLSFLISNGAFYWFGGRYATPNSAAYVASVRQWGPLFVRTTLAYIAVALLMRFIVVRLARSTAVSMSNSRRGLDDA